MDISVRKYRKVIKALISNDYEFPLFYDKFEVSVEELAYPKSYFNWFISKIWHKTGTDIQKIKKVYDI